jgi:leucyl aminopeptidase (aminopeptidase T)
MKTLNFSAVSRAVCVALVIEFFADVTTRCQEPNYAELAARVIKTSADIKPGDVVVVSGGKHNLGVMEELSIQAVKAGGLVNMFLDSDRLERAIYTEVPEKYLEQPPSFFAEWVKHMNVFIGLPGVEDPKAVFGDVPQERFAKANKASQVVLDALNASGVRAVFLGYPNASDAAVNQLDFGTYQRVFWEAVGADYEKISSEANRLKQILQEGKTVRVSSTSGTDFTFSLGKRTIMVDDGIMTPEKARSPLAQTRFVSLPSGTVSLAPIETSASGKVVIPRHQCQFNPVTGVSFNFKNGHLEDYKAEKGGQCFIQAMEPYSGPKDVFGFFQIGLNPAAKVMENPGDYRPSYAAGLVTIGVGDNLLMGGNNKVEGGGGFSFPIVKATVTVDGKTIVQDGKLVF